VEGGINGFANLITSFGPNCNCEEAWDTDAMRVPNKNILPNCHHLIIMESNGFFSKKILIFNLKKIKL
jgi:hypothetical protein